MPTPAPDAALDAAIASGDAARVLATVVARSAELLRAGDLTRLGRATDVVAPGGAPVPAALAWRHGYALHQSGHFAAALEVFARADLTGAAPADVALLHASEASSLWAQGDAVASRRLSDRALAEALACADDGAVAAAWVSQALVSALEGDRNSNLLAYERALAAAERAGDVLTQVRVHNNIGSLDNEEGRYTGALAHLDQALELAGTGVPGAVRALSLINRAEALLGLGRVEECLAELEAARVLARAVESPLLGYAVLGMGDARRLCGNATQAAAAYREAIAIAERSADAQILVSATSGLARVLVVDDLDEARGLVKRALDLPAALGKVEPMLAAGWVRLATGDLDDAGEFSRQAVREAGRRHDSRGLAEALELQAMLSSGARSTDLLDEAATLWTGTANAIGLATNRVLRGRLTGDATAEDLGRRRLRALGVRDDASRIAGPLQSLGRFEEPPVAIRALGSFTVSTDGVPVPASAWQSRKSRDALKILAGRRGRPITRDALADHLWPDADGTGNRLSVVLSTLRAVLDPTKQHPSDHFLVADRESVRLDVNHVEVDAVAFTRSATRALQAARSGTPAGDGGVEELERAAARYTGHYLEDDPYSDWAVAVRDELLALAIDVKRELASALLGRDEPQRAIPWLVGLLSDDPYDEPTHHALIRVLHHGRRHGEARRAYRAYAVRMQEIGTPATPLEQLLRE